VKNIQPFHKENENPHDFLLLHKHHQKQVNAKPFKQKQEATKKDPLAEGNGHIPEKNAPKFLFDYLHWKMSNLTNKRNHHYQFDVTSEYLHWKSKIESETDPGDISDKTSSSESA